MQALAIHVSQQYTRAAIDDISSLGNGLINDTFLIKTKNQSFVLQRINTQVFPEPRLIMENLGLLNKHIKNKPSPKLIIPNVLKTLDQHVYYVDEQNNFWRALEFVADTESKEHISHQKEAEQVGFALAHFHCLLSDIDTSLFHDTLPGFHITPHYFQQYKIVERQIEHLPLSNKIGKCRGFIRSFSAKINSLEEARQQGLLIDRMIHGDPKLNNFLFAKGSHKIISLIDLDTVKPGLVHYDIADCLRSCCHQTDLNTFDLSLCKIILNGYLKEMAEVFTGHDYDYLYQAIELIPFELGLRFFTDYLQGNQYFKVDTIDQNLDKALAQFQLCENIGRQENDIRLLIFEIKTHFNSSK
ncbi:MAG: phosphotransferase [Methylococcaceae bacterium]|nr:phosphotransferase [Methylococcaceae bacterium]